MHKFSHQSWSSNKREFEPPSLLPILDWDETEIFQAKPGIQFGASGNNLIKSVPICGHPLGAAWTVCKSFEASQVGLLEHLTPC